MPRISAPKRRSMRIAAFFYGAWCIVWLLAAVTNVGEARIGAHLVLSLTGLPSALASLYLPHASMLGTVVAAALGWAQWVIVAGWVSGDPPVKLSAGQER